MKAALTITLVIAAAAWVASPAGAQSYGWKYRPVYIFAPSADARFNAQIAALATAEARERDMVVIGVAGDVVSARFGPSPGVSAASLRQRFGIGREAFAVILAGKDGGVKLQSQVPVPASRIFGLIDSMPMRRQEMQRR